MDIITSRTNPIIMKYAKLKDKKYRDNEKCFLFEGIKLFQEAIVSNIEIEAIFICENAYEKYSQIIGNRQFSIISDNVYEKLSDEKSPQGVITIAKYIDKFDKCNKIDCIQYNRPSIMILSSIRDPGNLGTIIRTANAFSIDHLILNDCADIYNTKTIRATMGALFKQSLNIVSDLESEIEELSRNGYTIYATAMDKSAKNVMEFQFTSDICFVVGNEGHGLDPKIIKACAGTVMLPMSENAESLNVSIAASILMWEMSKIRKSF